jgi:hypothetical protein
VTAGLAAPFTRPARSAATLATITIGLTTAVLAVGLSSQITKIVLSIGQAYIARALFQRLTWLVVVLAAIGVFATLLTQAREKVREFGIYKALRMTPRQVIAMVICWAVAPPSSPRPFPCPLAPPWNRWSPGQSLAHRQAQPRTSPLSYPALAAKPRETPARRASNPAPFPAGPCGSPAPAKP